MPSYDARDLVTEVGEEWPDFDDVDVDDDVDDDPPDAA